MCRAKVGYSMQADFLSAGSERRVIRNLRQKAQLTVRQRPHASSLATVARSVRVATQQPGGGPLAAGALAVFGSFTTFSPRYVDAWAAVERATHFSDDTIRVKLEVGDAADRDAAVAVGLVGDLESG